MTEEKIFFYNKGGMNTLTSTTTTTTTRTTTTSSSSSKSESDFDSNFDNYEMPLAPLSLSSHDKRRLKMIKNNYHLIANPMSEKSFPKWRGDAKRLSQHVEIFKRDLKKKVKEVEELRQKIEELKKREMDLKEENEKLNNNASNYRSERNKLLFQNKVVTFISSKIDEICENSDGEYYSQLFFGEIMENTIIISKGQVFTLKRIFDMVLQSKIRRKKIRIGSNNFISKYDFDLIPLGEHVLIMSKEVREKLNNVFNRSELNWWLFDDDMIREVLQLNKIQADGGENAFFDLQKSQECMLISSEHASTLDLDEFQIYCYNLKIC